MMLSIVSVSGAKLATRAFCISSQSLGLNPPSVARLGLFRRDALFRGLDSESKKVMELLNRIFSVEPLAPVALRCDDDCSGGIEVALDRRVFPDPPLLLPGQGRRGHVIKVNAHLRLNLIDVLPSWTAGSSRQKRELGFGDLKGTVSGLRGRCCAAHSTILAQI